MFEVILNTKQHNNKHSALFQDNRIQSRKLLFPD